MSRPLVLCYHGVSDDWAHELAVRPRAFERQLRTLLLRRLRPVGALEAVAGRGRLLHVTFDDAYGNVASAVPILERLGVPATVFAVTGFTDGRQLLDVPELAAEIAARPSHLATMDWDELRALAERGFEIGSHTVSHPHLGRLSDAEIDCELGESRTRCEDELGRPCRLLAYPYGEHDARVRAAARRAGYEAAFALGAGGDPTDAHAFPRVGLYRGDSLLRMTVKTSLLSPLALALVSRLRSLPPDRVAVSLEACAEGFGYGWLAGVIPSEARRFRIADSSLAATLADAGAELVDSAPDVESASAADLRGDASLAVLSIDAPPHDSSSLAVRLRRRLAALTRVRLQAARTRGAVRRRGYPHVKVVLWDMRQPVCLPGESRRPGRRGLAEYLPQRALVIGSRAPTGPTLLEAALADAARSAQQPLRRERSSVRTGVLMTPTDGGLIRVAVGPGRRQVEAQLTVLETLRSLAADPLVTERVPWPIASGRSSLAVWSLERRLSGRRPGSRLDDRLLGECVEFLVALNSLRGGGAAPSMRECADVVAAFRPAEEASSLRALGARLDAALVAVPRGFGHGDFFVGNLLVERGRLTGVIDWDAGGPGRLPLIDLIHLRHLEAHPLPDEDWGPSLAEHLLPWARSGGDDVARAYCSRIGLAPDPRRLEALALAYWLDRLAYQLRTHSHRLSDRKWLTRSVDDVLHAVAGDEGS